jgi:hypothetical protein
MTNRADWKMVMTEHGLNDVKSSSQLMSTEGTAYNMVNWFVETRMPRLADELMPGAILFPCRSILRPSNRATHL